MSDMTHYAVYGWCGNQIVW